MGNTLTGTKGQPVFNTTPSTVVDLQADADYAALVGNRKTGTTTQRNAAQTAGAPQVWEGLLWGDTTDGFEYRYTSGSFVKVVKAGVAPIIATSASGGTLTATGAVTFSAASSVSLNGCFSSTYDNYFFLLDITSNTGGGLATTLVFRAAGSNDTATNYAYQLVAASGGSVTGAAVQSGAGLVLNNLTSLANGSIEGKIFNPARTFPTRVMTTTAGFTSAAAGISLMTASGLHGLSNAYDGLTLTFNGGTATGTLRVYGYSN